MVVWLLLLIAVFVVMMMFLDQSLMHWLCVTVAVTVTGRHSSETVGIVIEISVLTINDVGQEVIVRFRWSPTKAMLIEVFFPWKRYAIKMLQTVYIRR